jgi:hypothetical protein
LRAENSERRGAPFDGSWERSTGRSVMFLKSPEPDFDGAGLGT